MAEGNKADAKAAAARQAQARANDEAAWKGLAAITRSVLNGARTAARPVATPSGERCPGRA